MKITDLKTYAVDCYRTNWVFIRIETDEGVCGVGEGTLEHKERALLGALNDLRDSLIGRDPMRIEFLYQRLYRDSYWRNGAALMSALSAVEMALWDIKGKWLGVPVWELLGGCVRERVPLYANCWFGGAKEPAQFAARAKDACALGIRALKWDPFADAYMTLSAKQLDKAVACVAAVREAVGSETELMIEAHGRFNVTSALDAARELAPFKPVWLEEPVPPDSAEAMSRVSARSPIPIATGERLYGIHDFSQLLRDCDIRYVQPDVSHAGGMLELRKIAALAAAKYVSFAPHNPSGPVATAASMQLAACVDNFYRLEIVLTDVPWRRDVSSERLHYADGCLDISRAPGLGIDIHYDALPSHPFTPKALRHYDGTLTDVRPAGDTVRTGCYFEGIDGI